MGKLNRRMKHLFLRTLQLLGKLGYNHAFSVIMLTHAASMVDRHYGTLQRIEEGTSLSNIAMAMILAGGALMYLFSKPYSITALLGLFPHAFYTAFATIYAATTDDAPWGPPLHYGLALGTALALFVSHHLGSISFMLATRWELDEG